jgi:hypothetical protein
MIYDYEDQFYDPEQLANADRRQDGPRYRSPQLTRADRRHDDDRQTVIAEGQPSDQTLKETTILDAVLGEYVKVKIIKTL